MKKIFCAALIGLLAVGFAFAEDESETVGSPAFEIKNTFGNTSVTDKDGNFDTDKSEFENAVEAKFSVGFDLTETISITPFIGNETVFKTPEGMMMGKVLSFDSSKLQLGVEVGIKPMDMLEVTLGAGYLTEFVSNKEITTGRKTGNLNGAFLGLGFDINVENFFIASKLNYDLEAKFGSHKNTDTASYSSFENKVTAELTFDFFNFMKEGLNSGLFLSNEFTATTEKKNDDSTTTLGNDFGAGLHFNPVEYFDFKILGKTGMEKEGDDDAVISAGLGLAAEFKHKGLTVELEYNPLFKKGDDEGTTHEFKLAVGFEL